MKKLEYTKDFNLYYASSNPHVTFDELSVKQPRQKFDRKTLFLTATSSKNPLGSTSDHFTSTQSKTKYVSTFLGKNFQSTSQHQI